jgi:hypothetical protein
VPDYHSAYDGKFISGRGKRRFDEDESITAKRVRGRRALPSLEKFDATDGLADGDRWSTWDQTENLISNAGAYGSVRGDWEERKTISSQAPC